MIGKYICGSPKKFWGGKLQSKLPKIANNQIAWENDSPNFLQLVLWLIYWLLGNTKVSNFLIKEEEDLTQTNQLPTHRNRQFQGSLILSSLSIKIL